MKPIAIIVQNIIQWYCIKPLVQLLSSEKITTDIIVFNPTINNQGYHDIANSLAEIIAKENFKPLLKKPTNTYHICIAPYSDMITVKCKYKLGYCYGAATTKPNLTLRPEFKEGFHGMFLHDIYGAELFSIYGRTYIVPYLYLTDLKHKTISKKPTILFLPTYHDESTVEVANSLSKLKKDFYIISKSHHGTDFLAEEKITLSLLKEISDEIYDSTQRIETLFEKADIVLSDNSGATMDAFYAKKPVVMATKNINNGFKDIDTLQYRLAKSNIIPYANLLTPNSIKKLIETGLSKEIQERQSIESDIIFPNKKGGAKKWLDILKLYLNDAIDQDYCKIHDYLLMERHDLLKENRRLIAEEQLLKNENQNLKEELKNTRNKLQPYEHSIIHRAINKILRKTH